MVKQLDSIRKQNNLDSMDALEAAAKQQGVSFEDFKQHIRERVITQQVIGQEVYRKVNITQGDLQRFLRRSQSGVRSAGVCAAERDPGCDRSRPWSGGWRRCG